MTRVLIIEDDQLWASLISSYVKQLGASSRSVSSGEEAIDVIDTWVPDVLVLDMLLAGQTGVALLQELRSHDDLAKLPVIVCSSVAIAREQLAEYGVVSVLDKSTMTPVSFRRALEGVMR